MMIPGTLDYPKTEDRLAAMAKYEAEIERVKAFLLSMYRSATIVDPSRRPEWIRKISAGHGLRHVDILKSGADEIDEPGALIRLAALAECLVLSDLEPTRLCCVSYYCVSVPMIVAYVEGASRAEAAAFQR